MSATSDDVRPVIKEYFDAGHGYDAILDMLSTTHNVNTSLCTQRTRVKEAGLHRRRNNSLQSGPVSPAPSEFVVPVYSRW